MVERLGRLTYFTSIAVNAGLWTFVAAACIATLVYPEDPESMQGWGLIWFVSLPFIPALSGLASLSYPAYLDADSELLRFALYLSMVVTVGLLNPFGWAVVSRLLSLSGTR